MSRHSHWAKIKRGKGSADADRGVLFSKHARLVTVASREGGSDPAFNFKLRLAVDRAKSDGMPKDAIERAIARGAGGSSGATIETVLYEGIAPGGAGVLIECLTDNRNRALGEVKSVFTKQGGTLGGEGSVRWQFDRRGVLTIPGAASEEQELTLIDAGAEDIRRGDGDTTVLTATDALARVRDAVEREGLTITDAGLEWVPKQTMEVPVGHREQFESFLGALDACDDVQEVYTNAAGY